MTANNNYLKSSARLLKGLSVTSVIVLILLWELAIDFNIIPSTLLASPSQVIKLFIYKLNHIDPDGATLGNHMLISVGEALIGYIFALIIGIPLGLLMGWFVIAEGLARPIFEIIRPIPPVAWIPLAIFWFGIGLKSKAFIIWTSGLVPCVINSFVGVKMTNPVLIRMARTYGASDWEIFKTICIPSALPMVFGGLQVALATAWTALVAAELVAADAGLGFLITMGRRLLMPDMIVLGMIMVGLTGALIGFLVEKLERVLITGVRR